MLLPYVLTKCDTTFSINGVDKSTVFNKTFIKQTFPRSSFSLTASSKLHEEIESTGKKKAMSTIFKDDTNHSLNFLRHKQLV